MSQSLLVGAAETTINPHMGMQIDGNIGAYRPAQFVLSDLHARAIAFQQGEKRFLLLSLELLAVTREWSDAIRACAAEFGFSSDAVAVHAVQNHSSPSLGQIMLSDRLEATRRHPWIRGSDPAYGPLVMEKMRGLIGSAVDALEPVHLLFGSALEARAAFNRRVVYRDGSAEMGMRRPDPLHPEGPADPEVGVALFTNASLNTTAVLLHHSCHPVHWHPHNAVHSDWPGAWAHKVREELFPGAIPLVLNGCCGNVHHADPWNPHREDTPHSMARLLTEATHRALCSPYHTDDNPQLAYKMVRFGIPFRRFPDEVFADAARLIDEHPEPIWTDETQTRFEWDWHFAASLLDQQAAMATETEFEYEIQVLRIGDLAVVILPGEPFVEAQLEIKQASPARRTFFAHMSNRYVGYIPTAEAIGRGGYETRPSQSSKLAPEALQMIVEQSACLLRELFS